MDREQQLLGQFLTPEESAKVDAALLSTKQKFLTRLAIYALRSLQKIAQETGLTVTEITPHHLTDWVKKDENIKQQLEVDASFADFFAQLISSSLKPLKQISLEINVPIEDLTVAQIISWFEKEAKIK